MTHVELKIKYPYNDLIERIHDEMRNVYSYAPTDSDIYAWGQKSLEDESITLLKQSALLESGQSTEVRELQSTTMNIFKAESKYAINDYISEMTGAKFIIAIGDKLQIDFKAQAHRHNEGCTIHTILDAKYSGSERLVSQERVTTMSREDELWDLAYFFVSKPFEEILSSIGVSDIEGHEIEFVKAIRDNDLIPEINLSGLSDEDVADIGETLRNSRNSYSDFVKFLMKYTGLSRLDVLEKIASASEPTTRFNLSQLSFRFEYDIEIDEETFQSYFTIDSDEEYEAKLAAQAKRNQIKANVDVVKPKVLAKLEEVLSNYDTDDYDFDLEDLAEQIAECRDRVEVFNEIEDGDDDGFFSMVDDFAKSSTYVVHAYDGGCGHSLTGDRKDGHVYSFEIGSYLITGGYGYTFVILDGDLIELDSDSFSISDAFDLLTSAAHCSVLELPQYLVEKGYKDFDDEELLSASDESQVYDWVENNISASEIISIAEEEELIESVVGEYDRTDDEFEIDFSDCFED